MRATPTSQPHTLVQERSATHPAPSWTQLRRFKLIFPQAGPRAHVLARMPAGFSNLTPPAFRIRVWMLLGETVSTV